MNYNADIIKCSTSSVRKELVQYNIGEKKNSSTVGSFQQPPAVQTERPLQIQFPVHNQVPTAHLNEERLQYSVICTGQETKAVSSTMLLDPTIECRTSDMNMSLEMPDLHVTPEASDDEASDLNTSNTLYLMVEAVNIIHSDKKKW
ncbi:unnamed protein product [Didymodactylos carnosus]|uniref:Uncharacterized protein n=1 Tax=Didymodactylos carnosus TaxID=1234261 RepID=A0A815DDG5_9BILA|nr:unnamed protein product [Didymodactylos carnosus]CAF4109781.1 unnamed protein product [Didymodactylos carnosus]